MTYSTNPTEMSEGEQISSLKSEVMMLERREKSLLLMFEQREEKLRALLRTAEDRVHHLEVNDLRLTVKSMQKGLDDANTWIQSLQLSYLEEITGQLEETVLKAQGSMTPVCKPRDDAVFLTPPLSQYESWLDCFTFSEFGDSPSVYTSDSSSSSSLRCGVSSIERCSTVLVPETPPSTQESEGLTGHKRPREHTDEELMAMAD